MKDSVHANDPSLKVWWTRRTGKYGVYVNNVKNVLCCQKLNVEICLQRKHSPAYLLCAEESKILCTLRKFVKLHKNFSHPASDDQFNFLKLAPPWKTNIQSKQSFEKIQKAFSTCQKFSHATIRLNVSLPIQTSSNFQIKFYGPHIFRK